VVGAEALEESKEVQALKAELERARAVKEKFNSTAIKFRKEYDELRDINMATTKALEQETKRARKGRTWPEQVPRSFMGQQQRA